MSPLTVRLLTDADADAARRLGTEAFGGTFAPPADPSEVFRPGRIWYGAFDGPTLAAQTVDRIFDSCWGGVTLPTAGIASVTVAAEYRGRTALTPLFLAMLTGARERGAVVSTLFPTAPRIYRRFGYEVIAEYNTVQVPTAELAAVLPPEVTTTRRALIADVEAIWGVYDTWAAEQNGPLTRRGVSFPQTPQEYLDSFSGITVAVDATDRIRGYASWKRGEGYGEGAVLSVTDLLAVEPDAYRALLRVLGSFSSVTANTRIDTSGDDVVRTFLPSLHWQVTDRSPYMLRLLDVVEAFSRRRYAEGLTASLPFTLAGDVLTDLNGGYRLEVEAGRASCRRTDEETGRVLSPRGLALTFAGAQSSANLRMAGLLSGGEANEDLSWDTVLGGRSRHIRNYF